MRKLQTINNLRITLRHTHTHIPLKARLKEADSPPSHQLKRIPFSPQLPKKTGTFIS